MSSKISLIFGIACSVAAGLFVTSSAYADMAKTTAGAQVHLSGWPTRTPHHNTPTTAYGAGYFSYPADPNVASVGVTFKLPASITCASSSDAEWLLPGIWVYDSGGSLSQQVDVNLNCNQGSQLFEAVVCIAQASCTTAAVSPGDLIEATFTETGSGASGTIRDITTGQVTTVNGPSNQSSDYTVFVGDEGPSMFGPTAVPTFKQVSFTRAQVNGAYLGDWSPSRYNLSTDGSTTQITTTALSDHGDEFMTKFKHN